MMSYLNLTFPGEIKLVLLSLMLIDILIRRTSILDPLFLTFSLKKIIFISRAAPTVLVSSNGISMVWLNEHDHHCLQA